MCSSHLHLSRSVCRRAERSVVPLIREGACEEAGGKYLNRYYLYYQKKSPKVSCGFWLFVVVAVWGWDSLQP